jgi:hypothetical protein
MPFSIAFVRTKVLNEEPACRLPCAARLNCALFFSCETAVMARIAPFVGLIDTIAEAGSDGSFSVSRMARTASFWNFGSMVV